MAWLTSKEFCDTFKITKCTLKSWKDSDKIKYKKLSSAKYLYSDEVLSGDTTSDRINVCYARVSSSGQKDDLGHQVQLLKDYVNQSGELNGEMFKEIASGMNENRPEFNKMLKLITERKVKRVYITYKDRLTRFGYGYFETLFRMYDTELVVLNNINETTYQEELTADLIAIIHHFSMKMYSHRRKELNILKKSLQNGQEK